jgi:FixJ family two-component response regulator
MSGNAHGSERPVQPSSIALEPRVHVIDDDLSVRAALKRLLSVAGYSVSVHASADAFLSDPAASAPGCILLDLAMPGVDGLELQQLLGRRGMHAPVVFLTGKADVPACATAMKHGAVEFLTKPVEADVLIAAVADAFKRDRAARTTLAERLATAARLATLTARERQVLDQVMAGRLNKQIAAELGTAEKTVKVQRARGMSKMKVRSVAELVRVVERAHLPEHEQAD